MKTRSKTFALALSIFYQDVRKFRRFLKDKRITHSEKNILRSWLYFRDNKFKEAMKLLKEIPKNSDEFVEGQRELIYGIIHLNQGIFDIALEHLLRSLEHLEAVADDHQMIVVHNNLFYVYLNLHQLLKMEHALKSMARFKINNHDSEIRVLRCKFSYYNFKDELTKADSIAKELLVLRKWMNENQKIYFLIELFHFYIKSSQYEKAENLLIEMKNHRKFNLTQNFVFMKTLLAFLIHDQPIYAYEQHFPIHHTLYHQIKVIEALSVQDEARARKHWSYLAKKIPEVYLDDFFYSSETILFSVCLKKVLMQRKQKGTLSQVLRKQDDGSIEFKFYSILTHSKGSLMKEEAFYLLYGVPLEDKQGLVKLAQVVSRTRRKYNVQIKSSKGAFLLVA